MSQNGIFSADYAATDAGLNSAAGAAVAAKLPLYITADVTITGTVTLDPEVVLAGGVLTGSGTGAKSVIFKGPVSGAPRTAFQGVNVQFTTERQYSVYPEWWGAVAIPQANLQQKSIGGGVIDSTNAWKAAVHCGRGEAGGGGRRRYAIAVIATGWYAVTDEIQIVDHYVNIVGKNPSYGGTGLKWVGTPASTWSTKSILHFQGAQFSRLINMGFNSVRSTVAANRLLAAVRTSRPSTEIDTQRRITFENCSVGDNLGSFADTDAGLNFQTGYLTGGSGGTNANEDFYALTNCTAHFCFDAIRIDNNQAVDWRIEGFGHEACVNGLRMLQGGSVIVDGWYSADRTWGSVFNFTGPVRLQAENYSCEHMQALSFIRASGSVNGVISGRFLNFANASLNAAITKVGNTLTCTNNGQYGGPEFFDEQMVGGQIFFSDASVSGIITAVAADRQSCTVAGGANPDHAIALNGWFVDKDVMRSPDILSGYGSANTFNVKLEGLKFIPDGASSHAQIGTRMMLTTSDPAFARNNRISFDTCSNVEDIVIRGNGAALPRMIDLEVVNCSYQFGGGYGTDIYNVQSNFMLRIAGAFGLVGAAGHIPLSQFFADRNAGQHHIASSKIAFGSRNSNMSLDLRVPDYIATTVSGKKRQRLAGFLLAGRRYFGVTVLTIDNVFMGTNDLSSLAIGTPARPFQFGIVPAVYTNSYRTNALGGRMLDVRQTTDLQITGVFTVLGNVSQSGTTITSDDTNAFWDALIPAASLNNAVLYWVDEDGNVTYQATLSGSAKISNTQVTATSSQTVPAGKAYLEYAIQGGKRFTVKPQYLECGTDLSGMEINRLLGLPTIAVVATA